MFSDSDDSEEPLSFAISAMTGDDSSDDESEVDKIFNEALQETNRSLSRKTPSPGEAAARQSQRRPAPRSQDKFASLRGRRSLDKPEDGSFMGSTSVKIDASVPAHSIIAPVLAWPESPASLSSLSSAAGSSLVDSTRFSGGPDSAGKGELSDQKAPYPRLPEIRAEQRSRLAEEGAAGGWRGARGGGEPAEHQAAPPVQVTGRRVVGERERGRSGSPLESPSVLGLLAGRAERSRSPAAGGARGDAEEAYRRRLKAVAEEREAARAREREQEHEAGRALQRAEAAEREREREGDRLAHVARERDRLAERVREMEGLLHRARAELVEGAAEQERGEAAAAARVRREVELEAEAAVRRAREEAAVERERVREALARMERDRERDREAVAEMEVEREVEREELNAALTQRDDLAVRVGELEEAAERLRGESVLGRSGGAREEAQRELEDSHREAAALRRRVAELEEVLAADSGVGLAEQNAQLERSNAEHRAKIRQLLTELREAEVAAAERDDQMASLGELGARAERAEAALRAAQEREGQLQRREAEWQLRLERAEAVSSGLAQTEGDLRSRVHEAGHEHTVLMKRASDAEVLAEQLAARLEAAEGAVRGAQADREALMREVSALEARLADRGGHAGRIEVLERDVREAAQLEDDLRSRLKATGRAAEEMRLELGTQRAHADERHALCVQQRSQISALEAQAEAARSEVERLARRLAEGERSAAALEGELQGVQERAVRAQESVRALADQNEALQEQVRTLRDINAEKRREVTEAVGEMERLRGDLAQREREGRALQAECASLRQEVERLRGSLSEATSSIIHNQSAVISTHAPPASLMASPFKQPPPLPLPPQPQQAQISPRRGGVWDLQQQTSPEKPRGANLSRQYGNAHQADVRQSAESQASDTAPGSARKGSKQAAADARAAELSRAIQENQHAREEILARNAARRSMGGGGAPFAEGGTFAQAHETRKAFANQSRQPQPQQQQQQQQQQQYEQNWQQQQAQQQQVQQGQHYQQQQQHQIPGSPQKADSPIRPQADTAQQHYAHQGQVHDENAPRNGPGGAAVQDDRNKLPSTIHEEHEAKTRALQRKLVALNQEKQMMESEFTRLLSKGALKTAEEKRTKLELERALDKVGQDIASLRRDVRAIEGNGQNPKKSAQRLNFTPY